jgi:hypothetical protein
MVFLPNIYAGPVECVTYSSGVMLKILTRRRRTSPQNIKHMPVIIFFTGSEMVFTMGGGFARRVSAKFIYFWTDTSYLNIKKPGPLGQDYF